MESIIEVVQQGRLFELPDNDKTSAIRFLAHVIEALPEVPAETNVFELVMQREETANTGLGHGWACPHARVPFDGELACTIGWSPKGIDYGAPDGTPVNLVVMYLIPDNQRSRYVREVSSLARAITALSASARLSDISSLDGVRNYLLDLVDVHGGSERVEARARMIRLQAKASAKASISEDLSALTIEPLTLITGPHDTSVVLTQNPSLLTLLRDPKECISMLEASGSWYGGGWRILRRHTMTYEGGWVTYECLGIKAS